MSYEITYDRKFIRTTRGIIPMILSGSNNCTEQVWDCRGRAYERRERHWWAWVPRSLPTTDRPEADYLAEIAKICKDIDPNRELCKWNNSWLTYGQWQRWFQNGCKSAATIEEYLAYNRNQSFSGYISIYTGDKLFNREQEMMEYIHTTAELESWLDRANAKEKEVRSELNNTCAVYICLAFSDNEPLEMPLKEISGEVVVKRQDTFLRDCEKDKCLIFTRDPSKAKVFPSVEAAIDAIGFGWTSVRFVRAKKQLCSMNYTLKILHGRLSDRYILRKTKGHLFPAFSVEEAKRFSSREAAISFAKEARKRGFRIGETIMVVNLEDNSEETVCIREEAS